MAGEKGTGEPERQARARRRRGRLAWANLGGLAVVYVLGQYVAERTWLTTLVAYCPPVLFAAPTLLLLLHALARRDGRASAVHLLSLAFTATVLMGLRFPAAPPPSAPGVRLRVMTYNIHHGEAGPERIARDIRAENPDVVCLQEVVGLGGAPDPLPGLRAALPEYRIERYVETAVATRLPVRRSVGYPLITGGAYRAATEVEVEVDGRPVSFVSVHLATSARPEHLTKDWRRIPAYLRHTTQVRSAQVDRLTDALKPLRHPVVVCGDFNTPPRGRLYRRLTSLWNDAFARRGRGFGYTYSQGKPVLRIDYVFTGNGAQAVSARVGPARSSDHKAVVAEVAIP